MALLTPPPHRVGEGSQLQQQRSSISFGLPSSGALLRPGDKTFNATLFEHYRRPEAAALEAVVELKSRVRQAPLEQFWKIMSEGLADICGAQVAFISQRLANDEHPQQVRDLAGGGGGGGGGGGDDSDAFLCALAWYYQDRQGHKHTRRNTRYFGWGCPCAAMKYGQVFLIPSRLQEHSPDNPNSVFRSLAVDAYIGIPLFFNGKCNAHFGLAWSDEGSRARQLSWPFIESICHAFEDLILQRILEGATVQASATDPDASSQSGLDVAEPTSKAFIPPVHILSHELRTPMQGVIGMLDLMHDIVQDAVEGQQNQRARDVFKSLKHDIETIQASSKRAVDAADHVVQAYERELMMPSNRSVSTREPSPDTPDHHHPPAGRLPLQLVESPPRGTKRRHSLSGPSAHDSPRPPPAKAARLDGNDAGHARALPRTVADLEHLPLVPAPVRALFHDAISESLKRADGPAVEVEQRNVHNGRHFEARYQNPDGSSQLKHVDLLVDSSVPVNIRTLPHDFTRVISALLQNAIKFTTDAQITLFARLESAGQMLVVNVRDNGPGIDVEFQSNLFSPFQKREQSIRRTTEGLGLGLVVARSVAEQLGGVLNLASAETEGPGRGCDFEFRMPLPHMDPTDVPPIDTSVADIVQPRRPSTHGEGVRRASVASTSSTRRRSAAAAAAAAAASTTAESTPRSASPHEVRKRLSLPKSQGKLAGECPMNILVAEDNHINRKLLVNMLLKLGYEPRTQIHEAYDGAEAVRAATSLHSAYHSSGAGAGADKPAKPPPLDMILMDLWMPRMDGYEATERILTLFGRDADGHPPPMVWAVSADATSHAIEQAHKAGMKGFVKKPFNLGDLEKLVRETWAQRTRAEEEKENATAAAAAGPVTATALVH